MSVPAQLSPLRGGVGGVSFALGLVVAIGVVVYAVWLAVAAVAALPAMGATPTDSSLVDAVQHSVARPAAATLPVPPTPTGATLAFDQLWVSRNGNTIVAGVPTVGISALTGESMIQVPVTLTNNGERDWKPEATGFVGTLNQALVAESTEGDWMYRAPIVPHTSVTLTKVFLGKPGQFNLTVHSPDGDASFAGLV